MHWNGTSKALLKWASPTNKDAYKRHSLGFSGKVSRPGNVTDGSRLWSREGYYKCCCPQASACSNTKNHPSPVSPRGFLLRAHFRRIELLWFYLIALPPSFINVYLIILFPNFLRPNAKKSWTSAKKHQPSPRSGSQPKNRSSYKRERDGFHSEGSLHQAWGVC